MNPYLSVLNVSDKNDDDVIQFQAKEHHKQANDWQVKGVLSNLDRNIERGMYQRLVTFSGLFAGQYDLDSPLVIELLKYTEKFSTALDYDVATDYRLWELVRQFTDYERPVPKPNQELANHIKNKSRELHLKYPKNAYFNKYSFKPVSYRQALRLKHYIQSIIERYGLNQGQLKEYRKESREFLAE